MVAADARRDMFSACYNPSVDRLSQSALPFTIKDELIPNGGYAKLFVTKINDELIQDGGYTISKLTNQLHVIWNKNNNALRDCETFQLWYKDNIQKVLGKYNMIMYLKT